MIFGLCLLTATACDATNPFGPRVPLDARFTLAPGEVATLEDGGISLHFVQVTGDSRCPADAACIQGGDAVVHVRVFDGGGSPTDYQLHTGDPSQGSVVHRQLRITLVNLQPFPFSSRTIEPQEYRATFTIART